MNHRKGSAPEIRAAEIEGRGSLDLALGGKINGDPTDSPPPRQVKTARQLPPRLQPRLLRRAEAAYYITASPSHFDELVAGGLMPKPKRLGERRVAWDRIEIDHAIDLLPTDGDAPDAGNTWADLDG